MAKQEKRKKSCLFQLIVDVIIVLLVFGVGMAACSKIKDQSISEVFEDMQDKVSEIGFIDSLATLGMDKQVLLDVENISQNPELPTGCEVTSLTILLNYLGLDADKEVLADEYLTKADAGTASPADAFLGNPRTSSSYGCYAPVITEAAEQYLKDQGSTLKVQDRSGKSLNKMLKEVEKGNPVVIWGSMYIDEDIKVTKTWDVNGKTVEWLGPEHCMVLIGYDLDAGTVTVCDPLRGIETYDKAKFEKHYKKLGKQAVVIK